MVTGDMGNLTKNLSRSEFACRCGCGFDTVDIELPRIIQGAADHFAHKLSTLIRVEVSGPNRCIEHNEEVQKEYNPDYVPFSSKAQHIKARAADFKLFIRRTGEQIDPDLVADYFETKYPGRLGIGRYKGRTHVDNRTNGPERWGSRS